VLPQKLHSLSILPANNIQTKKNIRALTRKANDKILRSNLFAALAWRLFQSPKMEEARIFETTTSPLIINAYIFTALLLRNKAYI